MKVCIISGASAGIGAETAALFSGHGYRVWSVSRRPCPVTGVTHVACDLASPDAAAVLAGALLPVLELAETTVLIHNAARLENDRVGELESAQLRAVLETNVVGPNTLNRICIPRLKPGSAVLYVGSTLSEKAVPNSASYVTSKHAIVGMMRATCQDLAGRAIHTACICPGFTDTEMLREHVPEAALESVAAMAAYGRLVRPHEIAQVLHFAATHPVINGTLLHANLGQIER